MSDPVLDKAREIVANSNDAASTVWSLRKLFREGAESAPAEAVNAAAEGAAAPAPKKKAAARKKSK